MLIPDGWSDKSSSSAPDDVCEWEAKFFSSAELTLVEEGCSGAVSSLGDVLLTSSLLGLKDSCDTLKKQIHTVLSISFEVDVPTGKVGGSLLFEWRRH